MYEKTPIGSYVKKATMLLMLSVVLMCWACTDSQQDVYVKKPAQLLSKEQMISFLIDMHLAEAKMSYVKVKKPDSTEILYRNYEKYLFEKHHVQDSVYYQSYQYYLAHMDQLDEIYSAVVDSLNVMSSMEKIDNSKSDTKK